MSDYAFEGAKWPVTNITWSFADSTYSADSSDPFSSSIPGQYQGAIEQALQRWSSVTPLTFTQVPDSANPGQAADIRIGFGTLDTASTGAIGQTNLRWDGSGNLLPDEVVRLEDPGQLPLGGAGDGTFDYAGTTATLGQVALHELGHALGLAHSTDPNAVMYPSAGPGNQNLDGSDIAGIQALYGGPASAAPSQAPTVAATDDTLVLHLSEDAWRGDARFVASLDGRTLGGAQAVTASHGAGATEDFTFHGSFGAGPHDLAVSFVNDAWGGTPDTDRNLYVNSVDYDGARLAQDNAALWSNGTAHFAVGGLSDTVAPWAANGATSGLPLHAA